MKKEEVIGLDVGYSNTKIVTSGQPLMFRSVIGPARDFKFALSEKTAAPGEVVQVSDKTFFVGERTALCDHIYTSKTRDWTASNIFTALVTSALARIKPLLDESAEVSVVSGLPVDFMADKATTAEQISAVASILQLKVVKVEIIPQPFGTFFDYALDPSGKSIFTTKIGLFGVIDVGWNTTDFILIKNFENNIERAGGSITTGVYSIYDSIRADFMHRFGRNNFTIPEFEECVRRTKSIKLGKHIQDVSAIVKTHVSQTAQTIEGIIKSKWSSEDELDTVLLTGGGGSLLRDYLGNYSHDTRLTVGPQMANARGYFKRGMLRRKA